MGRNAWRGKPRGDHGKQSGCGRDVLGQTVLSTRSSSREGPMADGGQPCTTDIQRQWGSRSNWRLRVSKSAVYLSSSARYDGAVPCRHLYTRTAGWTESSLVLPAYICNPSCVFIQKPFSLSCKHQDDIVLFQVVWIILSHLWSKDFRCQMQCQITLLEALRHILLFF